MQKNHYNTILKFNGLKTARALNADGTVKYEVVYIELVDSVMGIDPVTKLPAPASQQINLSNQKGWEAPLRVDSSYPKASDNEHNADSANNNIIYPNAIENMRERLKTDIGSAILERYVLPQWMQDKQVDGKDLRWVMAVPLTYCKPGTSNVIKYRMEQSVSKRLIDISFELDRFVLDNNLSKWYDKTNQKFNSTKETTFDYLDYGAINPKAPVATVDYAVTEWKFDSIDQNKLTDVIAAGMIPGLGDLGPGVSKDIIWLNAEGLEGPGTGEGWNDYVEEALFDKAFDTYAYEASEAIPGYTEKDVLGSSLVNQQGGVWTIVVDSDGYCQVTFKKEIQRGEIVRVNWLNHDYYYSMTPASGYSTPQYVPVGTLVEADQTIYDGNGTRFFAYVDTFTNKDQDDIHLAFPRRDPFRNYKHV
jgi:hypothetical protein